ncbi:MAG: flagellar M-ring protein FliF [Betaproteobacteria bacterium]|nr:flagellar M-ring protein FliF [Betaproteobacteria bacterium]
MAQPPQSALFALTQRISDLPLQRKLTLAVMLAASIALVVGLFLWSGTPDYRVLFSNLSEKDAGSVTATLQQMNVPYKTEAGGTLLVPSEQVYDLRFKLAAQGLPKGGAVGFELMDAPKLGMTQFQEQLAFQRGLEGELSRTIQSLGPVETARVHLAIPKPSVFIRDKQTPTASVLVNLRAGRAIDPGQVSAIVHLVSSSVPELTPSNVTVVDQAGSLLSAKKDPLSMAGLNAGQLDYLRQIESYYSERVVAIVSPIVGEGNVRAEVRADLDFSEAAATTESFKPNPTPDAQAIRSQHSTEEVNSASGQAQGVPGALTNQPPGGGTAPVTVPAGANAGAGQGANASNANRKESTVNFELDKTTRHVKEPLGRIKRVSVAVVVNYRGAEKGEDGQMGKPTPLTPQEMTQINNLVKETIGFSQERGDTVNVVNAAFTENRTEIEIPLWKDPENVGMAKTLLKNLLVFGLAFYLVFGVLRPMLQDLMKPLPVEHHAGAHGPAHGPGTGGHTAENDDFARQAAEDSRQKQQKQYDETLKEVKEFSKQNPLIVAQVMRKWMAEE